MTPLLKKLKSLTAVTERDEKIFGEGKRNPKWVTLFRSPTSEESLDSGTTVEVSRKGSAITRNRELAHSIDSDDEEDEDKGPKAGEPRLRRHRKTSVVQLFYDLFFVANLTTFTSKHEINSTDALRTYVAFFVILWATWFQVAKYDVRFAADSAFERVCKALQFGVMVGFAVTGPQFDTAWEPDTPAAVQGLQLYQITTLILMASRLILCAQYCVVYWFIREKPRSHIPMILHILTAFVSAMIFLGLFFAFKPASPGNDGHAIIAWYVTLAFEAIVLLLIPSQYPFMSFKHTPIVERLGLLTLIILGEGIIGLCAAVSKIGSSQSFTAEVIGQIISAVAIIYFTWMLYADQTANKRVGRLHQEIWTVLHFPFHIAILLLVEGQITLTIWVKIQEYINPLFNVLNDPIFNPYYDMPDNATTFPPYPSESALLAFGKSLNQTFTSVYAAVEPGVTYSDIDYLDAFSQITNSTGNWTDLFNNVYELTLQATVVVCEKFEISPPEKSGSDSKSSDAVVADLFNVFSTVYTYFFVAAGLTLILLTVLLTLGRLQKFRSEMFMIVARYLIGLGLALLALMNLPSLQADLNSAINTYLYSAWVVPTVCICYALVVCTDNLISQFIRWRYVKWSRQLSKPGNGSEASEDIRNGPV